MSFFWWALVFAGLGVLALVFYAWLGLRLWRATRALARESAGTIDRLSGVGRPVRARGPR